MHTKMVQGDKQGDSWKNYAHIVNMKTEKGSFHRRKDTSGFYLITIIQMSDVWVSSVVFNLHVLDCSTDRMLESKR